MKKNIALLSVLISLAAILAAGPGGSVETSIQKILNRPQFRHSMFGIHFFSLETKETLYALNADKFFVPASTTKLITAGTALGILGADYRFRTHIYHSGTIESGGTLQGDLILVAAGDPNLSGRVTDKGTLLFENADHSYGGEHSRGVGQDPLLIIRRFAKQVADQKVKRITGRVIVDATLFPQGDRELGTGVVISPIVVNDNVVDVLVSPAGSENEPVIIATAPQTSYVTFVNSATTAKADSDPDLRWDSDVENSDGSRTVTLAGTLPAGGRQIMFSYAVPDPVRYAEVLLTEALREEGVLANTRLKEARPNFDSLKQFYVPKNQLAEHISPPLTEEIKVMLKVSQNLHASMMPYILSAVVAKKEAPGSGFELMRKFISDHDLNPDAASQEDGAGGSANFTPMFMTKFLAYWAAQKNAQVFHDALPILGRDGTLFEIQVNSQAAGHVFAKTGTFARSDLLNDRVMVDSKALAGYMTTKGGHRIAFAIYVNHVPVSMKPEAIRDIAGQAMGEIAAAAYELL